MARPLSADAKACFMKFRVSKRQKALIQRAVALNHHASEAEFLRQATADAVADCIEEPFDLDDEPARGPQQSAAGADC